ncbi:cytoplasmic protein [bacterium (candidate division B38) B3_B38]|nr:MAG: cytoplasmic protein [bacterium (candidate division B38) B3_B38]
MLEDKVGNLSDRRQFLKLLMGLGAGITFAGRPPVYNQTAATPDLAIAEGGSPAQTTRAALDAMGGMGRYISRGDIVLLKPNLSWDRVPEQAANTNPEVMRTLVELCYQAGAKKVKVFDNSINDARRCYVRSGIMEAVREAGADVYYVDERKFRTTNIGGEVLKQWSVYTEALEVDKLVNVPLAKHHNLCRLTIGMKNWIGLLGGNRGKLHQRIHQCIADLAGFFKPNLVVLDSVRILLRNGPQGGSLNDVKVLNMVVVGTDQVAIDSFAASLFGLQGSDVGYIKLAHERGLGSMELSNLQIKRIRL